MKIFSGFKSTFIEPLEYCDFIEHSKNKFYCANTAKNYLDYLKLKVIKPTQVLGSKLKIENWCTYAPTTNIFFPPGNHFIQHMKAI